MPCRSFGSRIHSGIRNGNNCQLVEENEGNRARQDGGGGHYRQVRFVRRVPVEYSQRPPAAARTFIEERGALVQVVRQGDGEKEKDERAGEGSPLIERRVARNPLLPHPHTAPGRQAG